MPYTPIMSTLGYVVDAERRRVLLVHRIGRDDDEQLGMWNGLGGKLEPLEDAATGLARELREEAGIEVTAMQLRGTLNWPGFGSKGEDWFALVFLVTAFEGTPASGNEEGPLEWVEIDRLNDLPMYDGDRAFLPFVFDDSVGQFHGVMEYSGRELTRCEVRTLPA